MRRNQMSEVDFRRVCKKFREKLSREFIERIERRIGQDFEEALKEKPEELLMLILQDIHLHYVGPFEVALELREYLRVHDISQFSLSLSKNYDFPLSKREGEASAIINAFYGMVHSLGFDQLFSREKMKWW
jgi:hypothetical protein